jgi:hypothetical protein
LRLAISEPSEYRDSREPPLLAKPSAWQVALLCARPDSVSRQLEQGRRLLKRQNLVSASFRRIRDLEPPDGNRTHTRRQMICEELAHQVLFVAPGNVSEAVEGGRLMSRQPDE